MEFTKEDRYAQQVYDKAMKTRSEEEQKQAQRFQEDMEKRFWEYLPKRLEHLIKSVLALQQNPKVPKAKIDEAEREVSKLLTLVQVHTLPEVIEQLTEDLQKEKTSIIVSKMRKEYILKLD